MFCEIMMKKIAIPTREDMVDDHFGHCAYYTVVTLSEQNQVVKQERLDSPEGCGCKSNIASVMQDISETILFLASEQARMLTGQVIKVSGGHAL